MVAKLHAILRPFLLRRLKSDVEHMLPRKKEIILYATMTEHQKKFQDHLVNKKLEDHLHEEMNSGNSVVLQSSSIWILVELEKSLGIYAP